MIIRFRMPFFMEVAFQMLPDYLDILCCSIRVPAKNNHHVQKMVVIRRPKLRETRNNILSAFAQIINAVRYDMLGRNRRKHDTGGSFAVIVYDPVIIGRVQQRNAENAVVA